MAWLLIALPLLAAAVAFLPGSVRFRVRLLPLVAALHLAASSGKA